MQQLSLKEWFEKNKVSSSLMSMPLAIKRAIEHEQNKEEIKLIN
ncbi:hypothetical protein [Tenacibaculum phage JQ]|nr:hypothetical protein [Tenacibaculum phage JQ]